MTSQAFQHDRVLGRIEELKTALDDSLPNMPNILQDIHKSLRDDPEIVTLLSEEEISVIVKGLEKHEDTVIVAKSAKKKTGGRKATKKITADDL